MQWDTLWINGNIATFSSGTDADFILQGAVACKEGHVVWVGPQSQLSANLHTLADHIIDLKGQWLTPGLIDCHTHLVYSGQRTAEFVERMTGVTYSELAQAGKGIQSTMRAVRAASAEQLFLESAKRLQMMLNNGVTCVEIKSGYGLDLASEAKILRVAKRLGNEFGITVYTTYLGAHALPPEFTDKDAYIDSVIHEQMPALVAEGLVDAVDVFCDTVGFTNAQCERVFQAAVALNVPVKCHAEQLSACGASQLAARYHALSVDHLEWATEADMPALANAGTVAVLLPGAFYMLREVQKPPVDLLRAARVPIALATDCNPGTSPFSSLPLMMNMACVLFGLTPMEAWLAVTRNAAMALGAGALRGHITPGLIADFAVWDCTHPYQLCANLTVNNLSGTIVAGVHQSKIG